MVECVCENIMECSLCMSVHFAYTTSYVTTLIQLTVYKWLLSDIGTVVTVIMVVEGISVVTDTPNHVSSRNLHTSSN